MRRGGRIVAHVLTESVVLTLTAGVAGVDVAPGGRLRALVANLPEDLPRVDSISIDGVVIATVTLGIGLAAAIAGLLPAWLLANGDVAGPLRSGGRGSLGGPGRRMRRALVVLQVSLAVAIVAAAGLLVRTVVHLQSIDIGYASDALVLMELSLPQDKYGPRARHEQFLTAGDDGARHCSRYRRRRRRSTTHPSRTHGTCRASPPKVRPPNARPATRR